MHSWDEVWEWSFPVLWLRAYSASGLSPTLHPSDFAHGVVLPSSCSHYSPSHPAWMQDPFLFQYAGWVLRAGPPYWDSSGGPWPFMAIGPSPCEFNFVWLFCALLSSNGCPSKVVPFLGLWIPVLYWVWYPCVLVSFYPCYLPWTATLLDIDRPSYDIWYSVPSLAFLYLAPWHFLQLVSCISPGLLFLIPLPLIWGSYWFAPYFLILHFTILSPSFFTLYC